MVKEGFVILEDGVLSFEIEGLCEKLKKADIPFSIESSVVKEGGGVAVRPDNAAAALTRIANGFGGGGLDVVYRIFVRTADYERAKSLLGELVGDSLPPEDSIPENDPPPAIPESRPVEPKGIWGWNTMPILNLVYLAIDAIYEVATGHFPFFFNGAMWSLLAQYSEAYNVSLGAFCVCELTYNLLIATFAGYSLVLVAKRSSSYPRFAATLFWVAAVCSGLDLVVAACFNIEISGQEIRSVFWSVGFALIWTSYFSKSVRIKNTFVNVGAGYKKGLMALLVVLAVSAFFCVIGMRSNNSFADGEDEKIYVCHLQVREKNGADRTHVEPRPAVSDAQFSEKSGEMEMRLKGVLAKLGSDDVEVALHAQDDIVLAYSLNKKLEDSVLQKALDAAELPFSLDLLEQKEYVSEDDEE